MFIGVYIYKSIKWNINKINKCENLMLSPAFLVYVECKYNKMYMFPAILEKKYDFSFIASYMKLFM